MHYENQNDFKTHFIKSSISLLRNLITPSKYTTKSTGKKQKFSKFTNFERGDTSRIENNHKTFLWLISLKEIVFRDFLFAFKRTL